MRKYRYSAKQSRWDMVKRSRTFTVGVEVRAGSQLTCDAGVSPEHTGDCCASYLGILYQQGCLFSSVQGPRLPQQPPPPMHMASVKTWAIGKEGASFRKNYRS